MRKAWLVLAGLLLAGVAAYGYYTLNSVPALARRAAHEFMAAAAAGDEQAVTAMVAPDAEVTPADVIGMYAGLVPGSFRAERAAEDSSGVEMLVQVGLADPAGYTRTTMVAMKRIGERWVVVGAGPAVLY